MRINEKGRFVFWFDWRDVEISWLITTYNSDDVRSPTE
jgi:hypothetical protein